MAATEAPMGTRKRKRAVLQEEDKEKEEEKNLIKELTAILKKVRDQRTNAERELLRKHPDHVTHIQTRLEKYRSRKARQEEYEEPESVIADKSATLAEAIRSARHLVVYTGAGVSTSASIPDYRGPDGIWTRLSQGRVIGQHDLTAADPTVTHMALYGLWQRGLVRHVVSQNCDGLHLRSGLPKRHMSELHGNMYLEVCASCPRQYVRSFDVTPKTSRQNHKTGRRCYECATPLIDTVVHFGERGSLRWPLNWRGACRQSRRSDVILCLGSSLKVLRKYSGLWCMHRPPHKRPRLIIVNLQWTPKDDCAALKINGRCDDVLLRVMEQLGVPIPQYSRAADPLLRLATPLHRSEPAPRCRLTRPDTPPDTPPETGEAQQETEETPETQQRTEETPESGPGRPDEASSPGETRLDASPSRPERGHTAALLVDRLGVDPTARSPTRAAHRHETRPPPAPSEAFPVERSRAERRSAAAPGRPAECAASPQSPPLRLRPEGGSLLLHTLLAGRLATAAAGAAPESAAQRRWRADTPAAELACAVTGDVTDVTARDVTDVMAKDVTDVTARDVTDATAGDVDVTCAVTELRHALVQTDPIEWREEEFTVVESLEEATCSSGDSCGSEPGHSPDGRCLDLSHIRLMDGDHSPFCLSDDCLDQLSTSDVIFIDVPSAPRSLVDRDYSRTVDGVDVGVTAGGDGSGGGGNDWLGQEAEGCESIDGSVRVASHPGQSQSQSPVQYADAASQMESLESDSQEGDASQIESVAGDASQLESVAGDASQLESVAGDASQLESVAGDASQIESVAGDVERRGDSREVGDGASQVESQDENSQPSRAESHDGHDSSQVDDSRNGTSGAQPEPHEEDSASQTPFGDFDSLHEVASQVESPDSEAASRVDSADEDIGSANHEEHEEGWQESRDGFAAPSLSQSRAESEDDGAASRAESPAVRDVWMDGGDSSQQSRADVGKLAEPRERWHDEADSSRDGAESSRDDGADSRKEAFTSNRDVFDFIRDDADSSQDGIDLSQENADLSQDNGDFSQDNGDLSQNNGDFSQDGIDLSQYNGDLSQDNGDLSQDNGDLSQDNGDLSQDGIDLSQVNDDLSQDNADLTRVCADASPYAEPAGGSGGEDSPLPGRGRPGRACTRRGAVSYRDPSSSSSSSDSNDSDSDSGPPPPPELAASSESSSHSSSESDGGDYVPFQAVFRVSRRMLKPVLAAQEAGADSGTGAGWYGRGCKARRKQRRLR